MVTLKGIDTSKWQASKVDFAKAKKSGYSFVILRVGCGNAKDKKIVPYVYMTLMSDVAKWQIKKAITGSSKPIINTTWCDDAEGKRLRYESERIL